MIHGFGSPRLNLYGSKKSRLMTRLVAAGGLLANGLQREDDLDIRQIFIGYAPDMMQTVCCVSLICIAN